MCVPTCFSLRPSLCPICYSRHLYLVLICTSPQDAIEAAVRDTLAKAGNKRHILNLGHGVLVGTPEEGVAHMFELSKQIKYAK